MPGKKRHRHQKLLGPVKLFGALAAFRAAVGGAGKLGEVHHVIIGLGLLVRVIRKGSRYTFRAGHSEVVYRVAVRGVREIGVDHVFSEVGAVAAHAVEVIYIRRVVEFIDQRLVLLDGGGDDQNIERTLGIGADHFAPFGVVAGLAFLTLAIIAQDCFAIVGFERAFDVP